MILIGQYDSPFVRRVGICLSVYGVPFQQEPWSVFGDADKIRAYNPLTRVPTLVLDDGTALTESHIILDYADSLAPAGMAMMPRVEPERYRHLRICALAMGMADKAVSLFYEKRLHNQTSDIWVNRCRAQIAAVLDVLERERAQRPTPFWFGGTMGHADVAVAVAWRFATDAHPGLIETSLYPALAAHSRQHEAMPIFQTIQQVFIPPA